MKKKILFIQSVFDTGGVSKSLLSLLHVVDKNRFQIDLLVMNSKGVLQKQVPLGVNLLDSSSFEIFFKSCWQSTRALLKQRRFGALLLRVLYSFVSKFSPVKGAHILKCALPRLPSSYDVAIDYGGQLQLYYMVDKVSAKQKITFFHNDYEKWRHYEKGDRKYFGYVSHIFTVSTGCVEALKRVFPEFKGKITLMENITDPAILESLSSEAIAVPFSKNSFTILTIGHVCERKGSSLAINAAKLLKDKGLDFVWYFLGENKNAEDYCRLVEKLDLAGNIVFMGVRENPYPYLKHCDIFVLPSQHEGKSIALDEAKLLCKPIVVTNFSTVNDQFENRKNATICGMNSVALADAILELARDKSLRETYVKNLESVRLGNTENVEVFYEAIRG